MPGPTSNQQSGVSRIQPSGKDLGMLPSPEAIHHSHDRDRSVVICTSFKNESGAGNFLRNRSSNKVGKIKQIHQGIKSAG